ncbi:mucin-2 isoform X2 [Calliphora vicina]|uniref:mucin-2 isoform X2 n=1 Tax=Calliphora vicina TaxID=7373 RepID=UPI00325BDBDB
MLRERRRHAHYKLNTRLDRKSSRGMIYENEELRLRTININAEVERGQTDIKRLRKENEQLRREIWTLRDECDRLNKRVKAKFIEHEHGVYSVRCSGNNCSCQFNEGGGGCDGVHSRCNSEDSDSCGSCCCHEDDDVPCNEDCCNESRKLPDIAEADQQSTMLSQNDNGVASTTEAPPTSKLTNFDHLSVVSEETLSNSEVALALPAENLLGYTPDICGSQTTLPSLVGPLTPLTPIELVANELNDLQNVVPSLSYFENVLQQHMHSNYGSTPESSSTTNSGKTIVKHTNGWDYNLESPFAQRRYQANSISPVMTKRSPAQILTTFVPTTTVTPPPPTDIAASNGKPTLPKKPTDLSVTSQQHPLIETVTITTLPPNGCGSQNATTIYNGDSNGNTTPKHFFAPMKPKLKLNTALANQKRLPPPPPPTTETVSQTESLVPQHKCEPPDIYVTNALATPYRPPNKPTMQPPPIPQRITSTSTMQAQTDSANLESILNDIEAISEDILAIQLVKNKSRDNLNNKSTDSINTTEQQPLQQNNKNTKPYRSEMNLLLTYDGENATISPAETIANNEIISESNTSTARRTRSLERDHTDSPSPHIPDPMQPFPENRKYIGFDRINKAAIIATTTAPMVAATATQTSPILNSPLSQRVQLPLSPLVTNVNTPKTTNGKQLPPTPPTRSYPTPLNIKCAGIARSSSVTGCLPTTDSSTNSPVLAGVSPNKSQLYAALANAAAKRAQFRSQPTQMTRSLDVPDNMNEDETEAIENAKRKARRVSIVCADTDSPGTPEKPSPSLRTQIGGFQLQPTTSGSCMDLHAVMPNPALRNIKQTSQSTPNSPHSSRKHEGSPLATSQAPPIIAITPNSTPEHHRTSSNASGLSQLLAHNHGHSNSYPNVISPLTQQHQPPRKNSQDTIKASAAEIACAAANAMRSKCSRRHSDGTVSHANQRISGASGGTNGTHHHHPHNHHHHQHSSSLVSNTNPHHSHHSRRDSNHETVASFSDRNSNSLGSSRESSASFSMRSQRRKLSVSSHTGGKIPWCGCWGNGCL